MENVSINGARGVLLNITGGPDMGLYDIDQAAMLVYEEAGESANIIFGAVVDQNLSNEIRVTVIATGFNAAADEEVDMDGAPFVEFEKNVTSFDITQKVRNAAGMADKDRDKHVPIDEAFSAFERSNHNSLEYPTFLRRQAD